MADTSAWIEFFRDTGHPVAVMLEGMLGSDQLAMTEVVAMEILAGARSPSHLDELRERILTFPLLRLEGLADFEEAATIYRTCCAAGETIRVMSDCLVAVPAIRAGAAILHRDSDFDAIARHTALRIQPVME